MKTKRGGVEEQIHVFLTDMRVRSVISFTPGRFTLRERARGILSIGGQISPRAGLNAVKYRNISFT
jgi:hypothetical protein